MTGQDSDLAATGFGPTPPAPPAPDQPGDAGAAGPRVEPPANPTATNPTPTPTTTTTPTEPATPADGLPPLHESWLPKEHPMHRPRHGRGQRAALVAGLVFFLVPALAFVFGVRPQAIENHPLAPFPSAGSGWGFFTGLADWATDHLPLRDAGIRAATGISEGLFGELPSFSGADRQGPSGPVGGAPTTQQTNPALDLSQVIQGSDGWLYYADDMTSKCAPTQPLANTISALAQLRSAVEASGRRFVLVVAPDKSTVFPQHLPAGYADKECAQAVLNPFWSQVTNVDGAIDLRAGLQSLARSGPVYYPQDTHWDDQGALYMLRSVVDQIDPTATTNWRTQPAARVSGPADLAALTGQPANEVDQTYRLFPDGVTDRTGKLAGDLSVPMTVHSTPTAGMVSGPVTVLGDSFLIPATRYLPAAFSDVTELNYGSAASEPGLVESAMTTAKTVVLEVVERNLTAGTAPVLEPQVIAGIRAALASHPMR